MNANPSATLTLTPAAEMPLARVLRAYACEAKYELVHLLRAPAMAIPFLLLPGPLYLFFGVLLAGSSPQARSNPDLANYILSGWCAYAAMGPAIFGVGCPLAAEREAGLLKLKRALPAPFGSHLLGKMIMSMTFALIAVTLVLVIATAAGTITLSLGQLAGLAAVMTVGAIPFAAIGLCIGAYASAASSPGFANLAFLPMLWLSGMFFPLPEALRSTVVIWPAFHLNQLAVGLIGLKSFSFLPPLMAAAVLVGVTVVFGGLAIRRLARVG